MRIFALKQRPPSQELLLIASECVQVERYGAVDAIPAEALPRARAEWPGPQTGIFPRAKDVPAWIAGAHPGVALRVTAHPATARLCEAFGGALVSNSANRHGEEPACTATVVRAAFGTSLDAILDDVVGGLERPAPIRDAVSGESVRF